MNSDQIQRHLHRANEVIQRAAAMGRQPFGALLVAPDGETVLAEQGNIDTVNHAESSLARQAANNWFRRLRGRRRIGCNARKTGLLWYHLLRAGDHPGLEGCTTRSSVFERFASIPHAAQPPRSLDDARACSGAGVSDDHLPFAAVQFKT